MVCQEFEIYFLHMSWYGYGSQCVVLLCNLNSGLDKYVSSV